LNVSTNGVLCEVKGNLRIVLRFLSGENNYLCLIDTNHNVKNRRYQLIGGSSAAVIGKYVLNLSLLKMTGIAKELWRIDDGASDTVVLRLASKLNWKDSSTIQFGRAAGR
jgi:hypothetical protein